MVLYEDHLGIEDSNLKAEDIAEKVEGVKTPQVTQILGNLAKGDLVENHTRTPKLTAEGIKVFLDENEREERRKEREERKEERETREEERSERRRIRKRDHRINRSIALLTLALVLTGGLQAVALNFDYYSEKTALDYAGYGAAGIFVIFSCLLIYNHWTDLAG